MNIQLTTKYTLQAANHSISILNFIEEYNNVTVSNALRFQYKYNNIDKKLRTKSELDNLCVKLFNSYKQTFFTNYKQKTLLHDIIDVLLDFSPTLGQKLTNDLRKLEDQYNRERINHKLENLNNRLDNRFGNINNNLGNMRNVVEDVNNRIENIINQLERLTNTKLQKSKTIYNDTQNVHTTEINNSVKIATKKLIDWYENYCNQIDKTNQIIHNFNDIKNYILSKTKEVDKTDLENVFNRIENDISTFNINITLKQVFIALFTWIQNNEHKLELENILIHELLEAYGYCASGHLSRMINVLQGFSLDFEIKISTYDQCNSVVTNYVNKKLQETTNEEIHDGMLTKSDKYINFIHSIINSKIDEWKTEYGDEFINCIDKVLSKFVE